MVHYRVHNSWPLVPIHSHVNEVQAQPFYSSDNVQAFRSILFRDMCFRWGVQHITTTSCYPQGSLEERVNRNLKAALNSFYHASHNTWDVELSWLSLVFNTAVHDSTGVTPDKLFLKDERYNVCDTVFNIHSSNRINIPTKQVSVNLHLCLNGSYCRIRQVIKLKLDKLQQISRGDLRRTTRCLHTGHSVVGHAAAGERTRH